VGTCVASRKFIRHHPHNGLQCNGLSAFAYTRFGARQLQQSLGNRAYRPADFWQASV
jgi:hypothetical protein